jgi:hypothetical protein
MPLDTIEETAAALLPLAQGGRHAMRRPGGGRLPRVPTRNRRCVPVRADLACFVCKRMAFPAWRSPASPCAEPARPMPSPEI